MSKLYVFGIGGTGARVLRSLTMMLASGVTLGDFDEVVPIIVDPDASNADLTRTVSLMNLYGSVRNHLTFDQSNDNQFLRTKIQGTVPGFTLHIQDTSTKKFREFIDLASMDRESQAMLKMLFSDKNLDSTMDVGFKGNPNIGSVVLNQMVMSNDFQQFTNGFAQGDKIFIISSIFGGTGASGFPLLLKTLRTGSNFPNYALINQAEIGAITVLPYFSLKQDDESEIDSSTFISKTKSALAYYEHNIGGSGQINALYFVGESATNTYDNNEGGTAQQNDAHLVEFLSALAVVDFCQKQHLVNTASYKELGLRDINGAVSFSSFYEEQQSQLYGPLTQFLMMANCLEFRFATYSDKSFEANNKAFMGLYSSQFMSRLRQLLVAYREWLGEMKRNDRSLDLFNLQDNGKPFEVVTGVIPKKVWSLMSDYDLVTARLNAAFKNCKSKHDEDRFLEMFTLATKRLIEEKLPL